jgi:septum formation protein
MQDASHTPGPPRFDAVILGSGSPRRREILRAAGVPFEVIVPDIPEAQRPGEPPREMAERLAREKALAVASKTGAPPERLVLAADTIVVLGGRVLGKPADAEHAVAMLRELTGRRHVVITGIAVARSGSDYLESDAVESTVEMHPADEDELRRYVATGEPLDKAGGYALQGEGRRFVSKVEGSETNVIGLPLEETLALLERAGMSRE